MPVFYFCILLLSLLIAAPVSAHTAHFATDGPTIQRVTIGFDEQYQDGNWVPIQVTLSNNGTDFSGKVSIHVPSSPYSNYNGSAPTYTYQEPVSLPPGSRKQVTLYIPLSLGTQGNRSPVSVDLLDNNNNKIASKTGSPNSVSGNTVIVGILSTQPNNFGMLNSALSSVLNASIIQTKILTATTFPTKAEILRNFDVIVLDNFPTQTLASDQVTSLQSWVNQGGVLIAAGGPEWQRTLGSLPASLLPVVITGTNTLPAGAHLLPVSGPAKSGQTVVDSVQSPVTISVAKPQEGSTVLLNANAVPLITETLEGQGSVFYLAYDPALEPFIGWSGTSKLWSGLLLRVLGDQILSNSTGSSSGGPANIYGSAMDALLKSFFPNAYPPNWLILTLLVSYILLLGPIRFILVGRLKKRDWSWRIVLTTIVVFTLLSYGLALQQKGTSVVSSSISVIQLNKYDSTGSAEHITTYIGVFVPSQGDFTVHVPGANLVQPSDQPQYQSYPYRSQTTTQQTIVQSAATGTDVDLKGVDIWTARTLVSKHDLHTTGGISSNLVLQQNIISGTVTNTLPYALNDVYVLVGGDYVALGNFPSQSTQQVSLALSNNLSGNQTNGQQQSIADQIANKHGIMGGPYSAYISTSQLQDEPHRHAAMLEALSGGYCDGNGPCYNRSGTVQMVPVNGVMTKRLVYSTTSAHDPLLLAGTPGTLIGWAQNIADPAGNVTINGQALNGIHETFIQAPLNISYAGTIRIPAGFTSSQIAGLEQEQTGNIQESSPGTYTMTVGNMTFEYTLPGTLPNAPRLEKSALLFRASSNPARIPTQNTGTTTDINHMQAYLYNWQTGKWDSVSFNQFVLPVGNAGPYIGPGNRVLLHLVNQDTTLGTTIFDKPTMELQATVSS
ncbi:MAG: hypothetical protein NVSMB44_18490 [Ktedonobacteraceae bacterium]